MTVSSPTILTGLLAQLGKIKTSLLSEAMLTIWSELSRRQDCGVLWSLWQVEDVRSQRPDLTDDQCRDVLRVIDRRHDANIGINWDVIDVVADMLYPEPENLLELREQYVDQSEA